MSTDQQANVSIPSTSTNKGRRYLYCFVPQCKSSTKATPEKRFFFVPKDEEKRKKWCDLARRDDVGAPSTVFYCCEDHFDLEKDSSNMVRHKLTGCPLRLNAGVTPSIFDCQPDRRGRAKAPTERPVLLKKRKLEILESCLKDDVQDIEEIPMEDDPTISRGVQVAISLSCWSKGSQTKGSQKVKVEEKFAQCNIITETPKCDYKMTVNESSESSDLDTPEESDEEYCPIEETSHEEYMPMERIFIKQILQLILQNPKGYIGVPNNQLYMIEMLACELKVSEKNLFFTLMKIKHNFPFFMLCDMFGISQQRGSKIFTKTVPKLAGCLKKLVVMPNVLNKLFLPLAFRSSFSNCASIIDCFEIQIQKPTDPVKQSLTWSDYKRSNTMKYLVSCTPNGCVNYISEGFGGRITDKLIVEKSGYLEIIPNESQVMADRGFKHIEPLLACYHCQLVRPPSLETDSQFTEEEVNEGKRISSLRIHVERLIRRFREFSMLKPHACIDKNLIPFLDCIVFICAGLINLQPPLIKH